jgi:hypothetical protein
MEIASHFGQLKKLTYVRLNVWRGYSNWKKGVCSIQHSSIYDDSHQLVNHATQHVGETCNSIITTEMSGQMYCTPVRRYVLQMHSLQFWYCIIYSYITDKTYYCKYICTVTIYTQHSITSIINKLPIYYIKYIMDQYRSKWSSPDNISCGSPMPDLLKLLGSFGDRTWGNIDMISPWYVYYIRILHATFSVKIYIVKN